MKRFKKIIISICFILAFIFSINIKLFANNGFTTDNNGNIESLNLINSDFNYNNEGIVCETNNQTITINGRAENTVFINNNPFNITLHSGTYYFSIQNKVNYNENGILVFIQYTSQGDRFYADMNQPFTINDTINGELSIRLQNGSNYNNCSFNIMLNKGTTPLNYFPNGTYVNEEIAKTKNPFYYAINNSQVELLNYNNNSLIITETINVSEEQQNIDINNIPTIKNYILTHEDYYFLKFKLNTPVNTNLVLWTNPSLQTQTYLMLNEDIIVESPSQNDQGYTFIETQGENYNIIKFNITDMYYNFEFNIGYDAVAYQQGYNIGYQEGESSGYSNGSSKGYNNGYNNGYSIGYNKGVSEASDNSLYNMILAIVDTPIHIFKGIFDFNVLGINLTNFVLSLVSILIVVWLLKFFL